MRKLFMGLVALLAIILGSAIPANAAGACTADAICFFDTSVSANAIIDHDDADTSSGECLHLPNAKTSWINNRTDHDYWVYTNTSCSALTTTAPGRIYAKSSGGMNATYNNKLWSYKRIG